MQIDTQSTTQRHDGAHATIQKKLDGAATHGATTPPRPPDGTVSGPMRNYKKIAKIGRGTFGVVYKAEDRRTGETVAVKRLRIGEEAGLRDLLPEARCLQACGGHPSLVRLKDIEVEFRGSVSAGDLYLIMEYVGPSLRHVMKHDRGGRPFSEAEVRRLMRQLLHGVERMHSLGIIHRDLKPGNMLANADGDVKICDFGLSMSMASPPPHSFAGTMWYCAPELLLGSTDYDELVDMWSLGCVMAELLTGEPLFPGRSETDQLRKVFDVVEPPWPSNVLVPHALVLPWRRWKSKNRLRRRFPKALSQAGFEVLSGLLTCDPEERLTAAAALAHPWFAEDEAATVEVKSRAQTDASMPSRRGVHLMLSLLPLLVVCLFSSVLLR